MGDESSMRFNVSVTHIRLGLVSDYKDIDYAYVKALRNIWTNTVQDLINYRVVVEVI